MADHVAVRLRLSPQQRRERTARDPLGNLGTDHVERDDLSLVLAAVQLESADEEQLAVAEMVVPVIRRFLGV